MDEEASILMIHGYSRHVTMRPQYFLATPCRPSDPLVGDYLGQPAATRWKVVANQCGTGGGPFQWFHQYYRSVLNFKLADISLRDYFQMPRQQRLHRNPPE